MPEKAAIDAENILGLAHKLELGGDASAPLAFLVHGRAGNFDVMWTFRRCLPEGSNIIAPQAFLNDAIGGYSWWSVNPTSPGLDDAAVDAAAAKLREFIERSIEFYKLSPSKIFALGFSQGAGLLSIMLQRDPAFFSGAALLAGFVVKQPETARKPSTKVFIGHGSEDEVVPIDKARRGAEFLKGRGFDVAYTEDPVGHKVGAAAVRELKSWLAGL